jgi:hypothetical protein
MDPEQLKREIEKRRQRAKSLGVDKLITELYFNSLRYYPSRLQYGPDDDFPAITEVREPKKGCLDFNLRGQRYSIRTEDAPSFWRDASEDYEVINLKLLQGDNVVLEVMVGRQLSGFANNYSSRLIEAFIEGNWIKEFEELQKEIEVIIERNMQRFVQYKALDEAKKFGISITDLSTPPDQSSPPVGMFEKIRLLIFPADKK